MKRGVKCSHRFELFISSTEKNGEVGEESDQTALNSFSEPLAIVLLHIFIPVKQTFGLIVKLMRNGSLHLCP